MATVEFRGVSKSFGTTCVLRNFSLTIADGEFIVLLGPSGCGKSTALRLLAGLESPDSGDLRIDGRSLANVAPRDRDVAMVFQDYALYPHMSVRQNIAFGLAARRVPDAEARVRETAELLGLSDLLDRRPAELSGGQRQRVAVGRAIARRPLVFLFDEPLSNLDARLRSTLRMEFQRLHRRLRTTSLYVTHDQVEAMTLGERIAVLHQGEIQQIGTPMQVYENPSNRFVAEFLGAPPMNFLSLNGETIGIRPEHVRVAEEGSLHGEVEYLERLGAETLVHVRVGNSPVIARHRGPAPAPGAICSLHLDPKGIHRFAAPVDR